ncbi:hypothetical protein ACFOE1_06415 [Agromyces mediolanus]|uniref:Uncharacterized protein n=1 Tax=Agromyces mediolanus TaxID=41986 RepID=A0A918FBB9_AGRME|nr:hypothetical protein [Agromyces mediolanus]GGR27287.1 hypothetical protein GCM10010196_21070 [Agromyces mediolanus]GLJ71903.1 hypothetical protein GCM10017583_11590 [Agromyces mediolanus]
MTAPIMLVLLVLGCLIITVVLGLGPRGAAVARARERQARAFELPVPGAEAAGIDVRIRRRRRVRLAAGLTGTALAVLAFLLAFALAAPANGVPEALAFAIAAFVAALAVGSAAGAARLAVEAGGSRTAHARARGLADYLPRAQRLGVWCAVAIAAIAWAVPLALAASGVLALRAVAAAMGAPLVALVAALLALVAAELGGRAIIARASGATPIQLAWADGWRSSAVRELFHVPVLFALLSTLASIAVIGYQATGPLWEWGQLSAAALFGAAVVIAGVALLAELVSRPASYFRRRLWREGVPA